MTLLSELPRSSIVDHGNRAPRTVSVNVCEAPHEQRHPLQWVSLPYLADYARFQGYGLTAELPDVPTLPREHWMSSISLGRTYNLFRQLRVELAIAAEQNGQLSAPSAAKLKHLAFGGVRRSERANIKAALRIENLSFKTR